MTDEWDEPNRLRAIQSYFAVRDRDALLTKIVKGWLLTIIVIMRLLTIIVMGNSRRS